MVLPYLAAGRKLQNSLMTDTCKIERAGALIYTNVPCRVHASRLFTETPDPKDANVRSMSEWGWTIPIEYSNVKIGDHIIHLSNGLDTIAGEVLKEDTWLMAIRIWATRPKDAVQPISITLKRFNSTTDTYDVHGTYTVTIHYDRNQPFEVPIRFSPAGTALYKRGTVIGDMNFDPKPGDIFLIGDDPPLPATILQVLPLQPQHVEAEFEVDVSGARM